MIATRERTRQAVEAVWIGPHYEPETNIREVTCRDGTRCRVREYRYSQPVALRIPPTGESRGERLLRLWGDDLLLWCDEAWQDKDSQIANVAMKWLEGDESDLLIIDPLPLEWFGNRLPTFTVELAPRSE